MSEAGSLKYENNFSPSSVELPSLHPDTSLPKPESPSIDEVEVRREVEEKIKAAFGKIQAIHSDNPDLKSLKEYGESLSQKFITLQEPVGMSPALADHYYDVIDSKPEQKALFIEVMERLRRLPQFDILNKYGLIDGLLNGFEKKVGDCRIAFSKGGVFKLGFITVTFQPDEERQVIGSYIPLLDIITILSEKPTDKDIVTSLASQGIAPSSVATAFHEIRHAENAGAKGIKVAKQKVKYGLADFGLNIVHLIMKYGTKAVYGRLANIAVNLYSYHETKQAHSILTEANSYEETNSTIDASTTSDRESYKEHVLQNYDSYLLGSIAANKIYDTIYFLKMMGVNEVEVSDLVKKAEYDRQTKTFSALDQRLQTEKAKWGIIDDRDFQLVIDALTAKMDLDKMLFRHETQKIVADELQIAVGVKQRVI